jgi:DNA-directed RNA polymerase subunit L
MYIEKLQKNQFKEICDSSIIVRWKNIPSVYINSMRQICISQINAFVIENVNIKYRPEIFKPEYLANRLQLIPLNNEFDHVEYGKVKVRLNVSCPKNKRFHDITSNDLEFDGTKSKLALSDVYITTLKNGESFNFFGSLVRKINISATNPITDFSYLIHEDAKTKYKNHPDTFAETSFGFKSIGIYSVKKIYTMCFERIIEQLNRFNTMFNNSDANHFDDIKLAAGNKIIYEKESETLYRVYIPEIDHSISNILTCEVHATQNKKDVKFFAHASEQYHINNYCIYTISALDVKKTFMDACQSAIKTFEEIKKEFIKKY